MLILTVADGSDKPYKYPLAFEKADLILLNKADLLPYVDFDQAIFYGGCPGLNPQVPVLLVSARNREGFEPVAEWLRQKLTSWESALTAGRHDRGVSDLWRGSGRRDCGRWPPVGQQLVLMRRSP
jgi:hypothetical protein